MWIKVGKYLLSVIAWSLIVGCGIYSIGAARKHLRVQTINNIEITIADSAMYGNLITTPMVKGWITSNSREIIGCAVKDLPISEIEGEMLKNGFVERVKIYPTYSGTLRVELWQRRPALRLLVDGYNGYATKGGYIFETPPYASLYVPVVTGAYRPPFPTSYRGEIKSFMEEEIKNIRTRIDLIEREKYPVFEREKQNIEDQRELRRMFTKKGFFESRESYDKRVAELRARKVELRRLYRYRSIVIANEIEKISQRQQREEESEKKLRKRCADFTNLINFAHIVENDKFWSSEVVQIIASESQNGQIRVSFAVRSGEFEVTFGSIANSEEIKEKLDKLLGFYEDALHRVGWSKYQNINVEYKGQVVCK